MKGVYLQDAMNRGKSNNLNVIRFCAAILVIFSHAFPLSIGKNGSDFLTSFSQGKLGFGGFAVGIFFFSSGLLVSRSVNRNKTALKYFKARCLRIFPPLFFIVVLTVMVIGPIFTDLDFMSYFRNLETYKYLLNAFLIPIHSLPAVFQGNIYGNVINGALWTLPVEFLCYIGLYLFFKLHLLSKKGMIYTNIGIIISFICCFYVNIPILQVIRPYVQPIFIFYMGMLMYVFKDKVVLNSRFGIALCFLWILFVYIGLSEIAMVFILPYILLTIIYADKQFPNYLSKLGTLSYGIYLCGFPIQQIIVFLNGGAMNPYVNVLYAIPASIFIGFIIYVLTDRPFQKH